MSEIHKRPNSPNELAEILRSLINDFEVERKVTYKSSERLSIDRNLKALRQLEKEQINKSRNNQLSI